MPASKAEQVLDALKTLLETVPGPTIDRNSVLPENSDRRAGHPAGWPAASAFFCRAGSCPLLAQHV